MAGRGDCLAASSTAARALVLLTGWGIHTAVRELRATVLNRVGIVDDITIGIALIVLIVLCTLRAAS